ncbi:MAG TPA: nucleoside-diphosphate sugar epimerase/dehydratase [Bryobacteraceae bacterium]|nr:nucleoside-diphosphate sugar epimerase/dehydratase [Bryobacteraceae bacterium]
MTHLSHILARLAKCHRLIVIAGQPFLFLIAGSLAFLLRFDFSIPAYYLPHWEAALWVWATVKFAAFALVGIDRGWWRFVSINDLTRLAVANVLGSFVSAIMIRWIAPPGFPRSIYLLDLLLCFLVTAAVRLAARMIADVHNFFKTARAENRRTLIYGAGSAGITLLQEIRRNSSLLYDVVGFLDDDPQKARLMICGAGVLCSGSDLAKTANKHRIDTVLIAIPSASGVQMTRILRRCHEAGVTYKTMPGLGEIIAGKELSRHIRDVAAEDLLGRTPVRLEEPQIRQKLHDRVVTVTGAGGSIGSELCRQIARFGPRAIVGYDIAETALFELELEMRQRFPGVPFCPEIGSVQNPQRLREVLECHQPSILFHAAAYKHVPMMEAHIFEAIENNVFGTYAVASAAAELGLEDFVMISTDKAVRPTSVMGVTKRLAELSVNSLQEGKTRFVSVRFGNVLGSNGSVIPLFKRQIAAGGPVTVTHPEMQRYFMTIPEASQLVLQASTMNGGRQIFVLDMGAPVKIVDLARNLILLSGLRPDEDIRIEFTGVRPGEKLYEELRAFEESTAPTCHEKIKTFTGPSLSYGEMKTHIKALRRICAARDVTRLVMRLKEIVPEYNPSADVLRRALKEKSKGDDRRVQAIAVGEG